MPVLGETITETFYTGAIGETFTRSSSLIDGVANVWDPAFFDLTGGWYQYTYTPLVDGFYSWNGNGSATGPLTINFEVDPTTQGVPAPPTASLTGTSLSDLIRTIAQRSMDLVMGTVTETSGNETVLKDLNNLIEDDNYFEGMEAYITSGLNTGEIRRIVGSDGNLGTISFAYPLPNVPQVGDTYEIYNRRGNGHRRYEYKQAINAAILEGGRGHKDRVIANVPTLVSSMVPMFSVPTGVDWVCSVEYLGWDGGYRSIRRGKANGWTFESRRIDQSLGMVVLHGNALAQATSQALRVVGYREASPLVNDADVTNLDVEWLVQTAAGILQYSNPDNDGNMAPGQYLQNRADAVRGKMATIMDPNCVKVK